MLTGTIYVLDDKKVYTILEIMSFQLLEAPNCPNYILLSHHNWYAFTILMIDVHKNVLNLIKELKTKG